VSGALLYGTWRYVGGTPEALGGLRWPWFIAAAALAPLQVAL
jgi:hypothetical protein